MNIRSRTPEPPYCWQSKEARRVIREKMNGEPSTAALLSLYDALTEIASNEGSETFQAGQPHLGEMAGMSARNVRRLEPLLEEIGVVHIVRPALRGHHTYSLLTLGQGVPSLGRDVLTLGQHGKTPTCPPVEEHKKNREEREKGKRSAFAPPSLEESTEYGKTIGLPISEAENFHDHFTANGWKVGGKTPMKNWQASMRTWKRRSIQFGRIPTPTQEQATSHQPKVSRNIDPKQFREYLDVEFPHEVGNWTPTTAPERVIKTFHTYLAAK